MKSSTYHTHQTALYVQCVDRMHEDRQSVLFNMHCRNIHPRQQQHAKLEQIVFCQLLKTLLHRTADICTRFRSSIPVVLYHLRTTIFIFCTDSVYRKLPLVTGNTLCAKVTRLLQFLCVSHSKNLVHLVLRKVSVCSPR